MPPTPINYDEYSDQDLLDLADEVAGQNAVRDFMGRCIQQVTASAVQWREHGGDQGDLEAAIAVPPE